MRSARAGFENCGVESGVSLLGTGYSRGLESCVLHDYGVGFSGDEVWGYNYYHMCIDYFYFDCIRLSYLFLAWGFSNIVRRITLYPLYVHTIQTRYLTSTQQSTINDGN